MTSRPQSVDTNQFSSFLNDAGWNSVEVVPLFGDAGLRRYFRLQKGSETALLMDMSRSGYEASLDTYINIDRFLAEKGIRVPEIYYASLDSGLSIIEDFGNESFGDILKSGREHKKLYKIATDVLIQIRQAVTENELRLGSYQQSRIRERLKQFVGFYMPASTGQKIIEQDYEEFQNIWAQIEESLPPCPLGVCHADYHLENLMWRPEAPEKYGLIDFQDAFWGFIGYDLLNLLEDARVSVPEDIKTEMKERYCADMSSEECAVFDDWYTVLSAHFHFRVIGLFVKLSVEREMNQYLEHIPRLQGYITKHLENPVLAPLKEWVEAKGIRFDVTPDLTRLSSAE